MKLDQIYLNWNFIYECKYSILDPEKWVPCYLITDDIKPYKNYVCVYTSYGVIRHISPENVRKMSEDKYIKWRELMLSRAGKHFEFYGFHKTLDEDLTLLRKS